MKLIQKYIIGISIGAVLALLGYLQIQNNTTSQLDGVKVNTPISQSGIETDTLKRLKIFSESGTAWNMSPFGSGKPLEEEKKGEFKKPNTEWKTRTLSGITYVFGEGNPTSVDLKESDLKPCSWQEGGDYCTDNGAGYVDNELEKALLELFNLPNWEQLVINCQKEFLETDNDSIRSSKQNGIDFFTLENLQSFTSIEDLIIINPETGRKNISRSGYMKLISLGGYIEASTWHSHNNDRYNVTTPNYSKCVDTYGTPIINSIMNIRSMPWRGAKGSKFEFHPIPLNKPILF